MMFIAPTIAAGLLAYAAWEILTHKGRTGAAIDRRLQEDVPSVENRYKMS